MNKFFTNMYKDRGKPHYTENIVKAEHERLLSSSLHVNPLNKNHISSKPLNDKDPLIVKKIQEEKKKLVKNYQLFLDTYHDHFGGKLKKSKSDRKKRNTSTSPTKGEKKFDIVIDSKQPMQRRPHNLKSLSRSDLKLDLKFVQNETLSLESKINTPTSEIQKFVMKELSKTNDEIENFSDQLAAIQKLLNNHKEDRISMNDDRDSRANETNIKSNKIAKVLKKNKTPRSLEYKVIDHRAPVRKQEGLPFMRYKSMKEALEANKNSKDLKILFANNVYEKSSTSLTKLEAATKDDPMDLRTPKKPNIPSYKSAVNNYYCNNQTKVPKSPNSLKRNIGRITSPTRRVNFQADNILDKKSHSDEKNAKINFKKYSKQTSPKQLYRTENSYEECTKESPKELAINRGTNNTSPRSKLSRKLENEIESDYFNNVSYFGNDDISNRPSFNYPSVINNNKSFNNLSGSGCRTKLDRPHTSPRGDGIREDDKTVNINVFQNEVSQGIFGNQNLPTGIQNSLFLKSELNKQSSDVNNDSSLRNTQAVFLRKMQQARYNMKQQNLLKPNQNTFNKINESKMYSTFCSALKDTLFEPVKS